MQVKNNMAADIDQTSNMKRIPQLDGLRGFAILSVIIYHYYVVRPTSKAPFHLYMKDIFNQAWSGVDLFFVLSGFLIGGILMENKANRNYFKAFYARRICRILPLYILLFVLFVYLNKFSDWSNLPEFKKLLTNPYPLWSYAAFVQNFFISSFGLWGAGMLSITWSLSVEEQFYLIFPFLIRFWPNRHIPILLVSLILCVPLFRLFLMNNHLNPYGQSTYVLLPSRMDALLLGVFGAWMIRSSIIKENLQKNIGTLYLLLLVMSPSMFIFPRSGKSAIFTNSFGYTWIALFYLTLMLIVILTKNKIILFLVNLKPLRAMGTISYFAYLFHKPIYTFCHYLLAGNSPNLLNGRGYISTAIAFLTTLILGGFSWVVYEKPILKVGRKFKYGAC